MEGTTLILPTLNEEMNIKDTLDHVFSSHPDMKVIVADDGSTDRTQDIVFDYKGGNAILLDRSRDDVKGITASVLDAARLVETENMIVMDADMQHPPEKLSDIIDSLRFHDLVIGSRTKVSCEWSLRRKMISWGGDALARIRLALRPFVVLDTMSGFFGIKSDVFNDIIRKHEHRFEKKGYKILFDILKYMPDDTTIGHVGYTFGERRAGKSKIGMRQVFAHMRSILK